MTDREEHDDHDAAVTPPGPAGAPATAALLVLAIALAALLAYAPTFSMPFFTDDIDQLHSVADYREGVLSLGAYLSAGHNEHRIPVMRLVALAATAPGGLDARAFHLTVFAVHVGCAVLVALMIAPAFGRLYALLGGVLFAVSGVFSSMVVWAPTSAVFSFSLFFILLARHAIAGTERPRVGLASIALLAAALSLNGSVVAVVPFCIAYWERLGATRARRAVVAATWIVVAALVFRWSSAAFVAAPDAMGAAQLWHAARNGVFLVLSASIRWIRSWMAASAGTSPNAAELLSGTLLAVVAAGALPRGLRRHVLVLSASAALLALAVGYGRREQPIATIYWTDRYYYAFGAPFAVASVAVARLVIDRARRRWLVAALTLLVAAAGAVVTRHQLHPQITAEHIRAHRAALAQARTLAEALRIEASGSPMRVPDGFVPLPGVHKGRMTLSAIVRGVYPDGIDGLEFARDRSRTDDDRLNAVLEAWARRARLPAPPVRAVRGCLEPTAGSGVDFRIGAFDAEVGPGFHSWEPHIGARWMSRRGRLTLARSGQRAIAIEASVPGRELRKASLLAPEDRVSVFANGILLGELSFFDTDLVTTEFLLPPGVGSPVELTFVSSFAWHPRQVFAKSRDARELSIAVAAVRLVD